MTDIPLHQPDERQKFNQETAVIAWKELQTFFAAGQAIYVSVELNLLDVAACLVADDKAQADKWLKQGLVAPVSDRQAIDWLQEEADVWALVVRPFVLVQTHKPDKPGS